MFKTSPCHALSFPCNLHILHNFQLFGRHPILAKVPTPKHMFWDFDGGNHGLVRLVLGITEKKVKNEKHHLQFVVQCTN